MVVVRIGFGVVSGEVALHVVVQKLNIVACCC